MIGENISTIRKNRGYTLSELAEQAHISKSYLSNIERNLKRTHRFRSCIRFHMF